MAESTIHYGGPLLSKAAAREIGKTKFFTGIPCKAGHIVQQFTHNGRCCECTRLSNAAWHALNKDKIRDRKTAYQRGRRIAGINQQVNRKWRHAKQAAQAGRPRPSVCDVCHETSGKICFDHCHETGRFRGWLCDRCNRALGLVRDKPSLLRKLAKYLDESRPRPIGSPKGLPLGF